MQILHAGRPHQRQGEKKKKTKNSRREEEEEFKAPTLVHTVFLLTEASLGERGTRS